MFVLAKKFKLLEKLPFERRYIASHLPADLMNLEKVKQFHGKVACYNRSANLNTVCSMAS